MVDTDPGPTPRADPDNPRQSSRASGSVWRQRAGFSVFVEDRFDGEASRRTRIYHDESGDEATFAQFEPVGLAVWMLRRLPEAAKSAPSPAGRDDVAPVDDHLDGWHPVRLAIRSIRQHRLSNRIESGRCEAVALVIWRRRRSDRSG